MIAIRRIKEETAMTRILSRSRESKLIAETAADIGAETATNALERNYTNDYAVYWQTRSGFFNPARETDTGRAGRGTSDQSLDHR
jgi:hypothetical protein